MTQKKLLFEDLKKRVWRQSLIWVRLPHPDGEAYSRKCICGDYLEWDDKRTLKEWLDEHYPHRRNNNFKITVPFPLVMIDFDGKSDEYEIIIQKKN